MSEIVQPGKIFDMPAEAVERVIKTNKAKAKPTFGYQEVPIDFDHSSLADAGEAEVVATEQGPVVVRRRFNTLDLYRADGRKVKVPIKAKPRYLAKRDKSGHPVFYESPPPGTLEKLKPTKICPYCFKKIRGLTDLERESNQMAQPQDPETVKLLSEMKNEGLYVDVSVKDDEYLLAQHIARRHRNMASFVQDPILTRLGAK